MFPQLFLVGAITTSLRSNSHTIQFTHVKCKLQWCSIHSELCNHHHGFRTVLSLPYLSGVTLHCLQPSSPIFRDVPTLDTFHINGIVKGTVFYNWLPSFSMMSSRFRHVAASLTLHSFLLPNNHHSIKVFFIHSSADGHLGCFYFVTIMNDAAVNTPVQGVS